LDRSANGANAPVLSEDVKELVRLDAMVALLPEQ
jgi:hypothetical protein